MSVLEKILAPISRDDFFQNYYEKKPLYIPRGPTSKFNNLPDIEKFEELLWLNESKLERILRVNKKGSYRQIPHHASGKDTFRWAVDSFSDGYTLILNGTDHLSKEIARIARSIEEETNSKVAANAFMTPANSRGFMPHFDTHDVFILQLEGRKHWSLYDQREVLPLDRQIYLVNQESVNAPKLEYTLEAGDLLYIPRGMLHGPYTTDQPSLHLTMGYRPLRWRDYLMAMVDIISENDSRFRESIRSSNVAPSHQEIEKVLNLFSQESSSPHVHKLAFERVREKFVSQLRALPGGHIKSLDGLSEITAETGFIRREDCICHISETVDSVRLQFPGIGLASSDDLHPGCIEAPIAAGGAFRFIASVKGEFKIKDLPEILTEQTRIELLKKLVKEGLLITTNNSDMN